MHQNYQKKAQEFLQIAPQFNLGKLLTEAQHPKTLNLSELAQQDLLQALEILREIDLDTLAILRKKLNEVLAMAQDIKETLQQGGRIFLGGCGSTGRLSLVLETLWRELHPEPELHNRVISFMAGGDIALIKAVEEFEDLPDYGARQLMELDFGTNDLLISTTEGGETPFVIGATEKAAEISARAPYFLYCNPDEILIEGVERSRRVIDNERICKLNLTVGPMAISGSTRMQATTILMLALGLALFHYEEGRKTTPTEWRSGEHTALAKELNTLYRLYEQLDIGFLQTFIEQESAVYQRNGYVFYEADEDFAISILTDTTERAPTFSLHPFENLQDRGKAVFAPALCYLVLPQAGTVQEAWRLLLGREPRALNWKGLENRVGLRRLYGHDFSRKILDYRREYLPQAEHATFKIHKTGQHLTLRCNDVSHTLALNGLSRLGEHLILKMLLNTHSTLVMGRLGRYEGNLMTYLKPSNKKLIDRTIRYVHLLLQQRGIEKSYQEIAYACFQEMETLRPDEPIVLHTLNRLLRK